MFETSKRIVDFKALEWYKGSNFLSLSYENGGLVTSVHVCYCRKSLRKKLEKLRINSSKQSIDTYAIYYDLWVEYILRHKHSLVHQLRIFRSLQMSSSCDFRKRWDSRGSRCYFLSALALKEKSKAHTNLQQRMHRSFVTGKFWPFDIWIHLRFAMRRSLRSTFNFKHCYQEYMLCRKTTGLSNSWTNASYSFDSFNTPCLPLARLADFWNEKQ